MIRQSMGIRVCIAMLVWFAASQSQGAPARLPLLIVDDLRPGGDETSVAESRAFSEFARIQIGPKSKYRTMERNAMMGVIESKAFKLPCYDLACYVAMGQLFNADFVLAGNLVRTNNRVELTLRLIDVKEQSIIGSIFRNREPCSQDDLLGPWGLEILAEILGISVEELGPEVEETPATPRIPTPSPTPDPIGELLKKYPDVVYVAPGAYRIGSNDGDLVEAPARRVFSTGFLIGRYEVTNAEYAEFVVATGHEPPPNWPDGHFAEGTAKWPVTFVSWDDAMAYAEWKGARLPTETEWEMAARGQQEYTYPWGNEFDPRLANTWESQIGSPVDVGSYPDGKSSCGAYDMAGNAAEWVNTIFQPYPGGFTGHPEYKHNLKVVRGGSWIFEQKYARAMTRYRRQPWEKNQGIGFRIARDAVLDQLPTPTPSEEVTANTQVLTPTPTSESNGNNP